ncbi:PREDICTED: uncharacterized protein LOC106805740 isoform X2 [Priapulus caudatus]|uniref:Uncharacterized protein LOC106805740 isoform X2 n=1 Tax=Priapulus caudatus TaxID=37621 RepID=A0ABM1DSM0_PRICU|nr:PREDICTED: uncharacterized protein LOC106805740 isoform X2 [Priapulus caudatus]
MSSTTVTMTSPTTECEGVMIPERILAILPSGITYHACHVEMESINENEVHFRTTLWLNLSTKEEFEEWMRSFQETSHVTWRVKRTFPTDGVKIVFKKAYRCQHNTRPEKATRISKRRVPSKHTSCQANMRVKIRVSKFKVHTSSRSKDHQQYHAQIILNNKHNHPVECADALKYRDVSESTRATLTDLFKRKYGPTQAVEMLKYELQMKYGEDYHMKAADRAVCPDIQFAHRLYRKVFQEEYGESSGEVMLNSLHERIDQFNAEAGTTCMAMDVNDKVSGLNDDLLEKFHGMCSDLALKMNQYPDDFRPAMNAMVQSYNKIKTDSCLISAMHSFGKSTMALRKGGMRRTSQIGVQPTATARRRPHMGRGGRHLHSGRPTGY